MSVTVGFVGLGAMGLPMARNLVARQFRVQGYDMRRDALDALPDAGGHAAGSAAEAARGADMLILMVVNAAQAEAVLIDGGALAALPSGAVVVLMATCPPAAVKALAERVAEAGCALVDAPVSGGTKGATAGTLTIMAAAPSKIFARARPVLEALGDKLFHVGETPGQGAAVKTVNQLLCGVHIAACAEALVLAEKAGIEGKVALEILGGAAASSWMLHDRGPRMLEDDPVVSSAVDIFVKDLGIVLDAGRASKVTTPLAAVAHQMFLAASAGGLGGKDDSQVVEIYRDLAGLGD
ncbi:NAD(P)-dependent oxidoreductase [Alsobacter sp. SYSU M60028]|uniref:NAD(P)-dependent oxidoreductase n=1 Tax=Alsobacter ponti TaxID=2962936 RepID=A0ABT1LFA1_9HYPH|nr:NAD(P)-dependent oxidoreductase [Alsobacter ponti]MCP8939578.1 NAD(P)-dependent oxidoreductase [Alsobacter ponti]